MRKHVLLGAFALAVFSANAQDKGFITGRASFSTSGNSVSDDTHSTGTFGPGVGIYLSQQWVVGLWTDYSGTTDRNSQTLLNVQKDVERRNTNLSAGPFVRYMKKVNDDLSLFGELSVSFGSGKSTNESLTVNNNGNVVVSSTTFKSSSFALSIGPGLMYKLSPHWGISAEWGALSYTSLTSKPADGDEHSSHVFGLALTPSSLNFGLNWFF